jgi:uncharacterized protein (DUF1778 family)
MRTHLEIAMRDAAINWWALRQQRDLIDQVFFRLDDARFRAFTAMLDAPLQPSPGLKRLLAVKAPWKVGA